MNLSIIGTGYVGLVTAVGFASHDHDVICVDIDKKKIEQINNGIPPIYEEGLEELMQKHKAQITATTDYEEAVLNSDVTFICVGTPSITDGSIDLTYVKETTKKIGGVLRNKSGWHVVVVKSTVIPGTTRDVVLPLLEIESEKTVGIDIGLAVNPEFLREGIAVHDFLNPDRIVIGAEDEKSRQMLQMLYDTFHSLLMTTSLSAAEMIKYASNAFLATKISFINEIGNLCKRLNIDTYEVADGVGLDGRIGRAFLDSGIGWGGSCFPKDLDALIAWAKHQKEKTSILDSVVAVNEAQPLRLVMLLKRHLPDLQGVTIGVLGLAFKPNTDDIRESRAIPVINKLLLEGAKVKAYDPKAMDNFRKLFSEVEYCFSAEDVLDADAVLITTLWDEFRSLDFTGKIVIDGRKLDAAQSAEIYEGVCW
jgi:UDPglucose 6-dehydrogenase